MDQWVIIFQFLTLPLLATANDNGWSYDIPQSLLWSLSFFILIGFLIMAMYSTAPPTNMGERGYPPLIVQIEAGDLKKITDACSRK